MKRFLFLSQRTDKYTAEVLPDHWAYLESLKAAGKIELSGGFADGTGGAIIVLAESLDEAKEISANDPIIKRGTHQVTIKEWLTK